MMTMHKKLFFLCNYIDTDDIMVTDFENLASCTVPSILCKARLKKQNKKNIIHFT